MKKLIFTLLFCAAPLSAHCQSTYTILAEDSAGLWGQRDGTGAGNEIVRAAFAAAGEKVTLETVPYNRCKAHVMTGLALACFGMSPSEELKGKVILAETPLYTTSSVLFVRKTDAPRYTSLKDLQTKTTIGTVLGYEYPNTFVQLIKNGTLLPDTAPSEVHSLKKLAAGRFELVIANLDELKNADYLLKQAGVADSVQIAFKLGGSATHLGFSTQDPRTPQALKAFSEGMAKIKKDGTLDKIISAWKSKISP